MQEYLEVVIQTNQSKGSSNLSGDKMLSMDALRIRNFCFKSSNELPSSSVSVKENSFVSINLQLIA